MIGFAKADTPLLDQPLEGPVYLRNGPHRLPDIVAALSGQIGEIDLVGRVDSIKNRLRSTFETVPDAPISHFTLRLDGGSKGLIESTEALCANPQRASVRMVGQNGKVISSKQKIQLPCAKKSKQAQGEAPQGKEGPLMRRVLLIALAGVLATSALWASSRRRWRPTTSSLQSALPNFSLPMGPRSITPAVPLAASSTSWFRRPPRPR